MVTDINTGIASQDHSLMTSKPLHNELNSAPSDAMLTSANQNALITIVKKNKIFLNNVLFNAITLCFVVMIFATLLFSKEQPNGLRYLRWGGDGEAVQPEKR